MTKQMMKLWARNHTGHNTVSHFRDAALATPHPFSKSVNKAVKRERGKKADKHRSTANSTAPAGLKSLYGYKQLKRVISGTRI